ncbi:hypothetical protein THRCLA_02616 [Thraustotheca clavata]|uniref:Transmembrane protein n=1 Tax=Thraustotheca clavata TaxID=74557 RepID=A0A1W0A4T3_9STRA|nr:hypothetical protein THRCLA_02616 [Thraustotheca clavata]
MGVRGDIVYPKRSRGRRNYMRKIASIAGLCVLLLCSFLCFLEGYNALQRHRTTAASDLFDQGAIVSRLCPQETVLYLFASGIIYGLWMLVGTLVLLLSNSRKLPLLAFVGMLSLCSIVWGILGAIWSTRKGCPDNEPGLFALAITTSAIFIFVCVPLVGLLGSYVLSTLPREQWLLFCLRCSCLTPSMKRFLVVLPFLGFTIAGAVFYILYANNACTKPFDIYVGVSSLLLAVFTLFICTCYYCSSTRIVICLILLQSIIALAWAILGTAYVSSPVVGCSHELFHSVQVLRIFLFVVSISFGGLTLCCRVERFCRPRQPQEIEATLAIERMQTVV